MIRHPLYIMYEYFDIRKPQFCGYTLFIENPRKGVRELISYEPLFLTLKEKNISSYRLEKMGFARSTYYAMKDGKSVSTNTIDQLCTLLECEVSDIMKFVPKQN